MLAYLKWIVKEHRSIAAFIIFIMGIAGVSIYGNVNELNPWKVGAEEVEEEVEEIAVPGPTTIIEKTIETRVESGITANDVRRSTEAAMAAHLKEFH